MDHPLLNVERLVNGLGLHPGALPGVKAALLHVLYGVGSDAQLADHLAHNVRFQAFVGEVWDEREYARNRDLVLRDGLHAPLATALRALEASGLMERPPFTPARNLIMDWAPPGALDFGDIPRLSDRQVQALLKQIDTNTLSFALVGAPEALAAKVYANLSTRVGRWVADEAAARRNVRPRDVAEVRARIGAEMRRMNVRGEL